MKIFTKKILLGFLCLLLNYSAFSHGVQLRWGTAPSGAIRVWVEHWHGHQHGTSYKSFPLNVRYTVGGNVTYKTFYANGFVNNTHWTGLPDNGNKSKLLSYCSGANRYNEWVYWDFNPPACNTPVKLEIINGPDVRTTEACSSLYPRTIYSNFNDNTGPSMTCHNISVAANADCKAIVKKYQVSAVDACGGINNIAYSVPPGSTFPMGNTSVIATATDKNGNKSTCKFNVHVSDTDAPVVKTKDIVVNLNGGGVSILPGQINNGSYDRCGNIASMSVSPNYFSCHNVGTNTVTLQVRDNFGNVGTSTARVTVKDITPPTAKCKNLTIQLDHYGQASIHPTQINAGSYDKCGIQKMVLDRTQFDCSNVGPNTVKLTIVDRSGNHSTCSALVDVKDDNNPCCAAPVAKCKNINLKLNADGKASITAHDIDGGSTAECGLTSETVSIAAFDCSNVGPNLVTLTLVDINGDKSSCTAKVNVVDKVQPQVATQNTTVYLDATGQAGISLADVELSATDACGISDKALSQTDFDCDDLGANTVYLKVIDLNGNVTVEPVVVTVKDLILPTITCPDDIHIIAQPDDCNPEVRWEPVSADDNCTYMISSTHQPGDRFPVGTTTVIYKVTDKAGNVTKCSFKVTVEPTPLVASISSPTYIGGWNISCNGASDGEATVEVEGGCEGYSYTWSDGQTGASATGLSAGIYKVKIMDDNGTVISKSITLTEPPVLTVDGGGNRTVYYGYTPKACSTLSCVSTGGTPGHSYLWSTGETGTSITVCPSETTVYTVEVTDANGCVATDEVKVCVIDVRCEKGGKSMVSGQGDKVMITHRSGNGKRVKYKTLCVSHDDVADHLAHGDILGEVGTVHGCDDSDGSRIAVDPTDHVQHTYYEPGAEPSLKAFPNPFSRSTTIEFSVFESDHATLKLYDITGKEIRTLYNDWMEAGQHYQVRLDRENLAHGIYFYRMLTRKGIVLTSKIVLSNSSTNARN